MNWGYRLTFLFVGFAAMMITLVYKATHTRYELVSKDYYSDELRYQEKIDGMNNAAVAGDITLVLLDRALELQLPAGMNNQVDSAHAWFYCRSDAASDRKMPLVFTNGIAIINTDGFAQKEYELKLQFNTDRKKYYYTKPIDLR